MSFVKDIHLPLAPDSTSSLRLKEALHEDTKTIVDASANPLAVAWSPDNKYVALGCYDCTVRVYCPDTAGWDKPLFILNSAMVPGAKNLRSPVTTLKFRPNSSGATVLLAGCSDGGVSQWHIGSGKLTTSFHEHRNQVLALDYKPTGGQFVTAGSDYTLRIYDDQRASGAQEGTSEKGTFLTKKSSEPSGGVQPTLTLKEGSQFGRTAHSGRVQAVKWVDEHTILSGGWDNTVQVWDVRQPTPVRSMFGATIYGADALDVSPMTPSIMVTGSCRDTEGHGSALQLWDWKHGKKVADVQWPELYQIRNKSPSDLDKLGLTLEEFEAKPKPILSLMCCKFSKCGKYLAAGGELDFRVFDTKSLFKAPGGVPLPDAAGELPPPKVVGEWTPGKAIDHCIYSVSFSNDTFSGGEAQPQLLVGAGASQAFVMKLKK